LSKGNAFQSIEDFQYYSPKTDYLTPLD